MKKKYSLKHSSLIGILLLIIAFSCSEEKIITYNADNYLQFSQSIKDSSICSFLAYPDFSEIKHPLSVELVGIPENRDRLYKIKVVSELTNAPKQNYHVDSEFTFKAGLVKDTCWITLKKTPEISLKPVRLVVAIVDSDDLKAGQTEYIMNSISITNTISQPSWWTEKITAYYLGYYSDKKYRLFVKLTGKLDMDVNSDDELRYNTLLLKYYLMKEKENGRTVYEDNGKEMTVALITG